MSLMKMIRDRNVIIVVGGSVMRLTPNICKSVKKFLSRKEKSSILKNRELLIKSITNLWKLHNLNFHIMNPRNWTQNGKSIVLNLELQSWTPELEKLRMVAKYQMIELNANFAKENSHLLQLKDIFLYVSKNQSKVKIRSRLGANMHLHRI